MSENPKSSRGYFATKAGIIAATVGSAVGLGNIWRFPYECGQGGGAAFLLCYIGFIALLGIPVICAEFILGRAAHTDFFSCFERLGSRRGWPWMGLIGIVASLMIISFYSVVAGWAFEYLRLSLSGNLISTGNSQGGFGAYFATFTGSGYAIVIWTVVVLALNYAMVLGGVRKGIERASTIMMPLLGVLLVIMCINSLMMPGAADGLSFLFKPDFSKITWNVILGAMGQAFFSLSIGLGCMLTYASYFKDSAELFRSAATTGILDTSVAILAGVMIFPAVFTYGIAPTQGPTLVFEVFPTIFSKMAGGTIWAIMFFFMLALASLTSTISMSEISIAFFVDKCGMRRRMACILSFVLALAGGVICALSFTHLDWPVNFFNLFNNVSSNILLPIGGLLISVYTGHILNKKIFTEQLTNNGKLHGVPVGLLRFLLRWICPPAIAIILAMSIGLI